MSIMLYFFSTLAWLFFTYCLASNVVDSEHKKDWVDVVFILLAAVVLSQGWIVLVKSYPGILPYVLGNPSTAIGGLR